MSDIILSNESFQILQQFSLCNTISHKKLEEFPTSCVEQLCDYKLIESHIVGYDIGAGVVPKFSDYSISELGKGYLAGRKSAAEFQSTVKSMADSAFRQAESAKDQADSLSAQVNILEKQLELAKQEADSANRTSEISKRISILSLLVSMSAVVVAVLQLFH